MVNKAQFAPPQLRGRDHEIALLHAAVGGVAAGRRAAVLIIDGAAGMGKTALLDSAERRAARAGTTFLRSIADPAERSLPLMSLLRALREPGLTSAGDVERSLTVRAATPLVVAIDDLHEADDATLHLLRGLATRLSDRPILWLFALAPGRADMTSRALACAGAERMPIGPLDRAAVSALAGDVLGGPPGPAVLDLLADLGGRPGPIVQLLRALLAEHLVALTDGSVRLVGGALQHALRDLGLQRPAPVAATSVRTVLTRSELAVAELVAVGATNRQAAEQLYLSPHTVSSHLRHAFEKLGIRSRIELALLFAAEVRTVV